jgi:endo-1,4-beta-xylanase
MKRRTVLIGLGTFAGLGAATASDQRSRQFNHRVASQTIQNRKFDVKGNVSLRQRASVKGLLYGAAIQGKHIVTDTQYASVVAQECGVIVPETELKWRTLRPKPSTYNFEPADKLIDYAQKHQILLRGHTLVWHEALPSWFTSMVNAVNAEQILTDHITTVMKHYAGKMHSWDVVNEAIAPKHGRSDGLRNTPWLTMLGPDYIDMAFRVAAKADPNALLTYNDFGMDYDTSFGNAKREAVLKLLKRLKMQGTPIHALGIQAHLHRDKPIFNPEKFSHFLQNVADLGLKIMITELDVTEKKFPTDVFERDRKIAAVYEDYLSVALAQPAVIAVLTWGLSDRYTWLSKSEKREDNTPVRPLPLDANFNRKLVWNAIARSLDNAPDPNT